MAYTDDAVLAKLSALNETHDSIATAAQWIMFHRRHAERTVQLWFQRLKDSPSPKRLNLIYLANEVTQQSKARHKEDFVLAFAPVIAEAISSAYKGAPSDVQMKLRRVVEVWRDRTIFEAPIQAAVESRIDEFDKAKGATRTAIGGSIFGSGSGANAASAAAALPREFTPLLAPQQSVTKLLISTQGSVSKAGAEFDKIMNGTPPAAPVHAARLNGLLKTLADGEEAVAQMVKARTSLKSALDALQAQYQKLLDADLERLRQLEERRQLVDDKKRQVEDRIMRDLSGLGGSDPAAPHAAGETPVQEPPRPEMEALTPPRPEMEALTPPPNHLDEDMGETAMPVLPGLGTPQSSGQTAEANGNGSSTSNGAAAMGFDKLSHLASQAVPVSENGVNKRRRVDSSEEIPNLDDGIDADVAETLRKESL